MMLKRFFGALLCTIVLVGKIHAQEVIVAREKKPEPARQTPEPPKKQTVQPSEELPSETPAPTPRKPKSREKKSAPATLTLEEMRAAGARAAEGLNNQSVSQPAKTRASDIETAATPGPLAETPRPVRRETPAEQRNSSRSSKSRTTNLEGIGPIRPTMMESGREPPTPSPSGQ